MQRISITIEDHLKNELDTIVAKGEKTAFIRLAIKKAVDDWHKQQALEKILTFKSYKISNYSAYQSVACSGFTGIKSSKK